MWINHASRLLFGWICLFASGCGNSADELVAQLRHSDPAIRRAAARTLGAQHGNSREAVASLAGALEDSDLEVRELAAESLGQIGSEAKSGLPALELALTDPQLSVRHTAALAIHRIDPQAASYQPLFIESLRAGDGPVFLKIGKMGSDAKWAVPTLMTLLSDRRPPIRALAAHALGKIAPVTQEVDSALRRALRDPEPSVRKAAQNALRQIEPATPATAKTSR